MAEWFETSGVNAAAKGGGAAPVLKLGRKLLGRKLLKVLSKCGQCERRRLLPAASSSEGRREETRSGEEGGEADGPMARSGTGDGEPELSSSSFAGWFDDSERPSDAA